MKKINMIKVLVTGWFLFWGISLHTMAQFNPDNPPEPHQQFKVFVETMPQEAGWSSGGGVYVEGEQVYIHTNSNSTNYQFEYWTKNGQRFEGDTQFGFYHTVTRDKVTFVAHYKYQPESPAEPTLKQRKRLYVQSLPEGCCSFNVTNGEKVEVGTTRYLNAYANQGYQFLGWYDEATKVSSYQSFYYEMPNKDVTLIAKFKYSPISPDEPNADPNKPQDDIQNQGRGDINGDKVIDVVDAVALLNAYLSGNTQDCPLGIYDVNNDGVIDVVDAVKVINKYLGIE